MFYTYERSMLDAKMVDHIKRAFRFFGWVMLVPLMIGLIQAWSAGLGFLLLILGVPLVFVTLAIGSVVVMARGARLHVGGGRMFHRVSAIGVGPVLLTITLGLALPLLRMGAVVGDLSLLAANYGHYEAVIKRTNKDREPAWYANDGGVTYSTDLGPPVRVAFNPAGMLDNWSGIIYDPTGDVMLANGFDPVTGRFYAPDQVTKLFGGDLVGCRHLLRHYYSCSFT